MLYKTINGVTLRIQTSGTGEPVVLIHGLGGSLEGMTPLAKGLKNQFQVIAYDCRGHGKSEKPPSYSLDDHVEDLLQLLDEWQIDRTALVGVSMGSYVAQAAAVRAPERFNKMVLVAPKAHGRSSSVQRILNEGGTSIEEASPLKKYLMMRKALFAPGTSILTKLKQWRLRSSVRLTAEQYAAAADALKDFDFRSSLPSVPVRTLVCSGKYDRLNRLAEGEEIAWLLPDARFVLFEKSAHHILIEEKDSAIKTINNFLSSD